MKKGILLFSAALCILALLSGCGSLSGSESSAATAEKTGAIPFTDNQGYAVAWVGYDDLTDLPAYLDRYLGVETVPIHYLSGGDYYLVIPRYADMRLKLYKNDMVTGESALVFEEAACKPFLLQCNISDIFPDATVSLSYEGETVEFSPFLSLQDGSLQIGERGLELTK